MFALVAYSNCPWHMVWLHHKNVCCTPTVHSKPLAVKRFATRAYSLRESGTDFMPIWQVIRKSGKNAIFSCNMSMKSKWHRILVQLARPTFTVHDNSTVISIRTREAKVAQFSITVLAHVFYVKLQERTACSANLLR